MTTVVSVSFRAICRRISGDGKLQSNNNVEYDARTLEFLHYCHEKKFGVVIYDKMDFHNLQKSIKVLLKKVNETYNLIGPADDVNRYKNAISVKDYVLISNTAQISVGEAERIWYERFPDTVVKSFLQIKSRDVYNNEAMQALVVNAGEIIMPTFRPKKNSKKINWRLF